MESTLTAFAAVLAAALAAAATVFSARQSRKGSTVVVDAAFLDMLKQHAVVVDGQLRELRAELYSAQDEGDRERARRRRLERRVLVLENAWEGMRSWFDAAGMPFPSEISKLVEDGPAPPGGEDDE